MATPRFAARVSIGKSCKVVGTGGPTLMKLGHIELFVTDPLAFKEFYRGVLGFEVTEVQGGNYV
jgi:catechol-2,3-dioxygenase